MRLKNHIYNFKKYILLAICTIRHFATVYAKLECFSVISMSNATGILTAVVWKEECTARLLMACIVTNRYKIRTSARTRTR